MSDKTLDRFGDEELGDFVPVVYARSDTEADRYCQMLEDHDVPALVDEQYEPTEPSAQPGLVGGVPVLVPQSLLDEARQIVTEFDEMDTLIEVDDDDEDEDEDEEFFSSNDGRDPADLDDEDDEQLPDPDEQDRDIGG